MWGNRRVANRVLHLIFARVVNHEKCQLPRDTSVCVEGEAAEKAPQALILIDILAQRPPVLQRMHSRETTHTHDDRNNKSVYITLVPYTYTHVLESAQNVDKPTFHLSRPSCDRLQQKGQSHLLICESTSRRGIDPLCRIASRMVCFEADMHIFAYSHVSSTLL